MVRTTQMYTSEIQLFATEHSQKCRSG